MEGHRRVSIGWCVIGWQVIGWCGQALCASVALLFSLAAALPNVALLFSDGAAYIDAAADKYSSAKGQRRELGS